MGQRSEKISSEEVTKKRSRITDNLIIKALKRAETGVAAQGQARDLA